PLSVCVPDALTVMAEPLISVDVNGVRVGGLVPTVSSRPLGLLVNDRATVLGWSVTLRVAWMPAASVAVSRSSSADGYSWSGAANAPLLTPSNVWTRCVWQLAGQWWMSNDQLNPAA